MRDRIVVTGGAGFIGGHIVEALLPKHDVVVLDDFSSGRLSNLKNASRMGRLKLVKGDIRDGVTVRKVLRNTSVVFHEAAMVSVPKSVKNPALTNDVNVNGTLNVLNAAVKNHVGRLIYASSSSVYGDQGRVPKNEKMRPKPLSPYGVSKLTAENYCQAFYSTYGLETVSLRYFNVYGPRQRTGPYSGVITSFLNSVKNEHPPVIFGDGQQTRDFTFISDVVQANMLAMTRDEAVGDVFNIGTGISTSINGLARSIIDLSNNSNLQPKKRAARPGEIRHSCADISKARKIIGYSPRVALGDGLTRLMNTPA